VKPGHETYRKSQKEATLSNTRISDQQELEKVVAAKIKEILERIRLNPTSNGEEIDWQSESLQHVRPPEIFDENSKGEIIKRPPEGKTLKCQKQDRHPGFRSIRLRSSSALQGR